MASSSNPFSRITTWLLACGLGFVVLCVSLAFCAAVWRFSSHTLSLSSASTVLSGFFAYLAAAIPAAAIAMATFRRRGSRAFLLALVGSSVVGQLVIVSLSDPNWSWTNDSNIFRAYVERLSAEGYSNPVLNQLSQNYDYRVWTRRAFPVYLAIHKVSAGSFFRGVQYFQIALASLSLLVTWRIARLWFRPRTAAWATCFHWLMPFRWHSCLDLNHHLLGGLYFAVGLWLLAEWFRGRPSSACKTGIALGAAILFPLMRLEGGIDLVFGASVLLVCLVHLGMRSRSLRQVAADLAFLWAIPLILAFAVLAPLAKRIDRADLHRHESGAVAFMARGWMPETGGEYSGTYEVVDFLTPPVRKKPTQLSILASQAFYNGPHALFRLLPVKMSKLFLLGYAAGTEEMLEINGALRAKSLAAGARVAFFFAVAPLVALGGFLLLPLLRKPNCVALLLPCFLLCAAYVFLGETSPRYSIYVLPFLFSLAAIPLSWPARRRNILAIAAPKLSLVVLFALGLALLAAFLLLWISKPALARSAFEDLRLWSPANPAAAEKLPATLSPFEIGLLPSDTESGSAWPSVALPPAPGQPGRLVVYVFPVGAPRAIANLSPIVAAFRSGDRLSAQTNSLPARFVFPYSAHMRGQLTFESHVPFPFAMRIGYATYEIDEIPAD